MRFFLKVFILLFITSYNSTSMAAIEGPQQRVEEVATRLFTLLKSGATGGEEVTSASNEASQQKFRTDVRAVLSEIVDFKSITKGVIGKNKQLLSDAQKALFQTEFERSIVNILVVAFDEVKDYSLETKQAKMKNEKRAQVPVEVKISNAATYNILFSLSLSKEQWRVKNLIINGVNLGLTFRNQFSESMKTRNNDVDAVIKAWSDSTNTSKTNS